MTYKRLATSDFEPGERLDRWISFGREALFDMVVVPDGQERFDASLTCKTIGGLSFTWIESTAAYASAPITEQRGSDIDQKAFLMLHMPHYGFPILQNAGRETALCPMDMLIRPWSNDWSTCFPGHVGMVSIKIPSHFLDFRVHEPNRLLGQIIKAGAGASSVTTSVILAVKQLLDTPLDEAWDDAIADVLLSSLSLACRAGIVHDEASAAPGLHQNICRRGRQFIDRHFADPDLDIRRISQGIGVTVRTLQRAFLTSGEGPREYLRRTRLEHARKMLERRTLRGQPTVTDIAFAVGFNDLSHFSRAFKKRFGRPAKSIERSH